MVRKYTKTSIKVYRLNDIALLNKSSQSYSANFHPTQVNTPGINPNQQAGT